MMRSKKRKPEEKILGLSLSIIKKISQEKNLKDGEY